MKTSRFTESQIVKSLREHDGGRSAKDICRELGISSATFYQWKRKYGGLDARDLRRLKDPSKYPWMEKVGPLKMYTSKGSLEPSNTKSSIFKNSAMDNR